MPSFRVLIYADPLSPLTLLSGSVVKNPPAVQETPVQFLGWEDPLEKRKGYPLQYSESPWTEEPGGLQPMGSQRVGHD